MADPLHQFVIQPIVPIRLGELDVSFTNSALFMVLAVVLPVLFIGLSMRGRALVPGRWQSMAEMFYEFIAGLIRENIGPEGRRFFPFVFSLFMFILFGNVLGLIPYSFTFTSHIVVTGALALMVITIVTLVGILRHGLHFLSLFAPKGVPLAIMPLIIPVEILSYLSRPVSLSIRLFANMMAGHTILKVLAGFTVALGLVGVVPLAVNIAFTGFELMVAVIQAYVFTILTCIYLNDAINLH